ncbi:lamin tail domain-containing protein [Akkermansiaceae bacterium]|nr:lamin tail domain-containing protein [Akkermansiaceae bacterium]
MMISGSLFFCEGARISWEIEFSDDADVVHSSGRLIEACNFGNGTVQSPIVNGVQFTPIDFTSGEFPARLLGLNYNTGESGKRAGTGINELFDTIAYRSGVDPQTANLTDLVTGQRYQVQFFYYHNSVNRSLSIRDELGGEVTLNETGVPLVATGTFIADSTVQRLTFDANTGSQFINAYQIREITTAPPVILGEVLISEFMASNEKTLIDGGGASPDWIEIWNPTSEVVNLSGWALSSSPEYENPWIFPRVLLGANEYLLVFATGEEKGTEGGQLHTDFTIQKKGGSLTLLKPGDEEGFEIVSEFVSYPPQKKDVSFGYAWGGEEKEPKYLLVPTPRQRNSSEAVLGFVGGTSFHPNRGFYNTPIDLVIETREESTIRYTLDGSQPTANTGLLYSSETGINISGTTTVRAAAFREGYLSSGVDTHTYLFPADIVDQPANPSGFSSSWPGADYGMDQDPHHLTLIAGDPDLEATEAKKTIQSALEELPALSLVMDVDDWFNPATGIYANSTARGTAWEKACSAELIFPLGLEGKPLQIDCGVRIQGNSSRNPTANPKHSLRLAFREQYGDSKLRYPWFGREGPQEFDTLILRSNSQDAWVYSSTKNRMGQFVRDAWARESHRRMGHESPDGNWVHLFINGLYWGVYNPTERPDSSYGETKYGGAKENWDIIKNHEEVLDGNQDSYRKLLAKIQVDPMNWSAGYRNLSGFAAFQELAELIDLEMMIDYMIHNMYAAADDWPGNFYMGYDRTGSSGGWRFFDWDNEHGMKNSVNLDRTQPNRRVNDSPTKFHHALKSNPEYRLLFADRLHRAFFNGGVLYVNPDNPTWDLSHPKRNVPADLWMNLTSGIETALIAESARWGDYRRSTPYTVSEDFRIVRNDLIENWFPRRSAIVLEQFRGQDLYPKIGAPELSQFGGLIEEGFPLQLSGPDEAAIYYTLDGSDPRVSGGEVSGTILLDESNPTRFTVSEPSIFEAGWRQFSFDDSSWGGGRGGIGYELAPSVYRDLIGTAVPEMMGVSRSALIRIPFEVSADELSVAGSLNLKMRFDDGFVAYLNGVQIASANAPANLSWNSGAVDGHPDNLAVEQESFDVSAHLDQMKVGGNLLSIHGLNDGVNSSDFLISAQLIAGGSESLAPSALRYKEEVMITSSGPLKARSLIGGQWSALTETVFAVGIPASPETLVISEIMYHAKEGSDYDYIELMNISSTERLHLGGIKFIEGIQFEFPYGIDLPPRGRLLLVSDLDAFVQKYGEEISVVGEFSGNLNNGGERLLLVDHSGQIIRDFSYLDDAGWPQTADGEGPSLILKYPESSPDHSKGQNWRKSRFPGGNPGKTDTTRFKGNPSEDFDGDLIPALLEYAMGTSDQESNQFEPLLAQRFDRQIRFSYLENSAAEDVALITEISKDLKSWEPLFADAARISREEELNGRIRVNILLKESLTPQFLRLRAVVK